MYFVNLIHALSLYIFQKISFYQNIAQKYLKSIWITLIYFKKNKMRSLALYVLPIILLFKPIACQSSNLTQYFCSSKCADVISACYGTGQDQCYACSVSLFNINSNLGVCQTKAQHQIQFYELKNHAMDISGYSTNKPAPQICLPYTISGKYVAGDYIQKTFNSIPLNHYQLVIRFNIGHMGSWTRGEQMKLQVDGVPYVWQFTQCYDVQDICSGAATDCFKMKQFVITHNAPKVTLKFTSLITETDPLIKFWGIKDLLIGIRTCHSKCLTCFGPAFSDCSSCAPGYYLLGNLCVPQCTNLVVYEKRICVEQCPAGYFDNGNKKCQKCQKDCVMCTSAYTCQVWDQNKQGLIWIQNKPFWIFLIVVGLLISLYIFWRCIIKKHFRSKQQPENDINKKILTQNEINPSSNKLSSNSTPQEESNNKKNQQATIPKDNLFEIERKRYPQQELKVQQVLNLNTIKVEKRKRKRGKMLVFDERSDHNIQPSIYELQVTNEAIN